MGWVPVNRCLEKEPTKKEIDEVNLYRKLKIKARFLADENVPRKVVQIMLDRSLDVLTHIDVGLTGHSDEDYVAYVKRENLFLVTCDNDFLDNRRYPLISCPAIVVLDVGAGSNSEISRALLLMWPVIKYPRFYDKWAKLHLHPNLTWTEDIRFLDGSSARTNYRLQNAQVEEWIDG